MRGRKGRNLLRSCLDLMEELKELGGSSHPSFRVSVRELISASEHFSREEFKREMKGGEEGLISWALRLRMVWWRERVR